MRFIFGSTSFFLFPMPAVLCVWSRQLLIVIDTYEFHNNYHNAYKHSPRFTHAKCRSSTPCRPREAAWNVFFRHWLSTIRQWPVQLSGSSVLPYPHTRVTRHHNHAINLRASIAAPHMTYRFRMIRHRSSDQRDDGHAISVKQGSQGLHVCIVPESKRCDRTIILLL